MAKQYCMHRGVRNRLKASKFGLKANKANKKNKKEFAYSVSFEGPARKPILQKILFNTKRRNFKYL